MAIRVQGTNARIQRREKFVFRPDLAVRECIQKCRFTGIGVSDKRDFEDVAASRTLNLSLTLDRRQPAIENSHLFFHHPAIDLDLLFTHSAAGRRSTALPFEMRPEMGQPRQQVLQSRQRDLRLSFARSRVLRKNLDNHSRTVENRFFELLLEISELIRRKFHVQDDCIPIQLLELKFRFFDFPFADESRGTDLSGNRVDSAHGFDIESRQKSFELVQGILVKSD